MFPLLLVVPETGLKPSDYLQWGSLGIGFLNIVLSWRLVTAMIRHQTITKQHLLLVCIFVVSALGFLISGALFHSYEMGQNPEVTIHFDLQPRWSDGARRDFGDIILHDARIDKDMPVSDAYIPVKVTNNDSIQLDIMHVWEKLKEYDSELKAIAKQQAVKSKEAGPSEP